MTTFQQISMLLTGFRFKRELLEKSERIYKLQDWNERGAQDADDMHVWAFCSAP